MEGLGLCITRGYSFSRGNLFVNGAESVILLTTDGTPEYSDPDSFPTIKLSAGKPEKTGETNGDKKLV